MEAKSKLGPKVGVMGSAADPQDALERTRLAELADRLGSAIGSRGCVLITGATTGLPDLVSRAAMAAGGLTVGFSPAGTEEEHVNRYRLPIDGADLIFYSGFGLKGRNVLNVRAADVIIIFGGAMGALNEFTIAYDEGKVIGVLDGSGGVANHIRDVVSFAGKSSESVLLFDTDPHRLTDACLEALASRNRSQ